MKILVYVLQILLCSIALAQSDVMRGSDGPGQLETKVLDFGKLADSKRDHRLVPMKVHLPIGDGPFPVVVLSHGAGGNWNSNFAQAHHLATHGYVVVCLEHAGSNTKTAKAGGIRIGKTIAAMTENSDEVLNRPKDVSFAVDQISEWNKTHESLRGKFDLLRVGAMGHSFGAFTTLTVCGARPALDWIRPAVGKGKGLGPDLRDKRIRCGVALSPQGPGKPFFIKESYRTIGVPLLGISGSRDKQQHAEPIHRKESFKYWPAGDRYLLWISNANHLSFSDSTGSVQRNRERKPAWREDVQKVSRAATLLFFDKYLKGGAGEFRLSDLEPYAGGIAKYVELLVK
ncbi:MAG: hypothetical protein AAF497_02225 [Planctomycetota bacterium]